MTHIAPAYSREDAERYFDRVIKAVSTTPPPYKIWAVAEPKAGRFCGITSLVMPDSEQRLPEVGIMMKPFVRSIGLSQSALLGVQQWVASNTQYDGLVAKIANTNVVAQRFAQRCGFELQSEQKWAWFIDRQENGE